MRRSITLILLCTLVAGLAGYFGPWVAHPAVALMLNGHDMAEYVKFLPEVRQGKVLVIRELFLLPLLAASVSLVLLAANRSLRFPVWVRALLVALAVPIALAMLPPVWTPALLLTPEFRKQTAAILVCLALVAFSPLLRRLPWRAVALIVLLLSLATAILPVWQFFSVRPAINTVYGRPVTVGWGIWLMAAGFALTALTAAAGLMPTSQTHCSLTACAPPKV